MTSVTNKKSDLTVISSYAYGYDDAGQRTWVKRTNGCGDYYQYDAIGQLTNVLYEAANLDTTPSGWTNEAQYVFDAAGNRTSVTLTNTGTTSYTANALNQYTAVGGVTPTYDDNGNLTYDGTWTYTYDRENRLIQAVNGGTTIAYTYDVFNRLIERAVGSSKLRFYYDQQWRVIEERNENDAVVRKYVYGPGIDEPVRWGRNSGPGRWYYHADAMGNVTESTGVFGALVERYTYDVYGTPTIYYAGSTYSSSLLGNRFMFQGRDRDPDTGLYNFRNRYYSPSLGRFVQIDPLGKPGFETTSLGANGDFRLRNHAFSGVAVRELNKYGFVGNNPINFRDELGLSCFTDCMTTEGARILQNSGLCGCIVMLLGGGAAAAGLVGCLFSTAGYPACAAAWLTGVGIGMTAGAAACFGYFAAAMAGSAAGCAWGCLFD